MAIPFLTRKQQTPPPINSVAPAGTPSPAREPVISVRGVKKIYQMGDVEVQALRGVDVDIFPGEMTAIMGPSGSGKSTLMNVIGCLDVPTEGVYKLDGVDVSKLNDNELADIRSRKIGFVFQSFNLLPRTSALANVELPMIYSGISRKLRRQRALECLTLVGLGDRSHHRPNELSGGQQQRVAIARSLGNRPAVILADEPTGNLDTKTSVEIFQLFQRLNREQGITVIFVTHNPETADYCSRIIHVRDGEISRDEHREMKLVVVPGTEQPAPIQSALIQPSEPLIEQPTEQSAELPVAVVPVVEVKPVPAMLVLATPVIEPTLPVAALNGNHVEPSDVGPVALPLLPQTNLGKTQRLKAEQQDDLLYAGM